MVAVSDRTLSKDSRKQERDAFQSPYARPSKLSEATNSTALQRAQPQRKKIKSSWGLSSLWKWISSYPEDNGPDNVDEEIANGNAQTNDQQEEEPPYVASPAALRLRQRGHEVFFFYLSDLIYK